MSCGRDVLYGPCASVSMGRPTSFLEVAAFHLSKFSSPGIIKEKKNPRGGALSGPSETGRAAGRQTLCSCGNHVHLLPRLVALYLPTSEVPVTRTSKSTPGAGLWYGGLSCHLQHWHPETHRGESILCICEWVIWKSRGLLCSLQGHLL